MPRNKKTDLTVLEKPVKVKKTKTSVIEPEVKYFVDGHSDVREYYEPKKEYEIDWNKIAANVREAADMIKKYEPDDGPLTKDQIKQIKETAIKPSKKTK